MSNRILKEFLKVFPRKLLELAQENRIDYNALFETSVKNKGLILQKNVTSDDLEPLIIKNNLHKTIFESQRVKLLNGDDIAKCIAFISKKLPEDLLQDVLSLFSLLEATDKETAAHCARVCIYSIRLGESCNLTKDEEISLIVGSLLHDIGKVKFPPYLFKNKSDLDKKELEVIQKHPEQGIEIVKGQGLHYLGQILDPIKSHHEDLVGTGYPEGLKGSKVPLLAKIVKVADCFDAMTKKDLIKAKYQLIQL